jgi:hypothetical protein
LVVQFNLAALKVHLRSSMAQGNPLSRCDNALMSHDQPKK